MKDFLKFFSVFKGFSEVFTVKASEFYKYNISNEEKSRIDRLELFDEYEPWHLKCSHYTLISATIGEYCTSLIRNLYNQSKSQVALQNDLPLVQFSSEIIKLKPFPIKFGTRFGHSVCALKSKLFVFGGFGELATDTLGKHLRLSNIEVVDLEKLTLKVLEFESNPIGDRIFLDCKTYDQNSIMITFGRSNPSKIFNSIIKLNYQEKSENSEEISKKNISFETIISSKDENTNLARYRHSVCPTFDSKLFIFGGKFFQESTNSNIILNDAFFLDSSNNIIKINVIFFNLNSLESTLPFN